MLKNAHGAVHANVTSQHELLAAAAIESLDDSVELDLDIGSGMHVRALAIKDAAMLVDATSRESAPALWGPRPAELVFAARRAGGAVGMGPCCRRPVFDWHLARPAAPRRGRANARSLRKYRTGLLDTTRAARPGHRLAGRICHDFVGPPQPRRSPGSCWRSIPATGRLSRSPSAPATTSNSVSPSTAATGYTRMPSTTHGTTVLSGLTSAIEQSSDRTR